MALSARFPTTALSTHDRTQTDEPLGKGVCTHIGIHPPGVRELLSTDVTSTAELLETSKHWRSVEKPEQYGLQSVHLAPLASSPQLSRARNGRRTAAVVGRWSSQEIHKGFPETRPPPIRFCLPARLLLVSTCLIAAAHSPRRRRRRRRRRRSRLQRKSPAAF